MNLGVCPEIGLERRLHASPAGGPERDPRGPGGDGRPAALWCPEDPSPHALRGLGPERVQAGPPGGGTGLPGGTPGAAIVPDFRSPASPGGDSRAPAGDLPDADPSRVRMTFVEHLDELRTRLLRSLGALAAAVGISMCFYRTLVDLATIPHFRAMSWLPHPPALSRFYVGDYWGSIGAVMKLSCIVGFFFASPLIARELWGFVSGGLYSRERRYIRAFAPTSFLLFVSGCVFGYFVMIPYSLYAMV